MNNFEFASTLVAPFAPTVSMDKLVVELNRIYHSAEARNYNSRHPEIHDQLPPLWSEMIAVVESQSTNQEWDVLDFGCGTGFASEQILRELRPSQMRSLTCYDPSPEMLSICEKRIGGRLDNLRFCSDLSEVLGDKTRFNLLATNSLLHHLPEPGAEIAKLDASIAKDAWWLLGHEPSKRFYKNPECQKELSRYQASAKLRREDTL